MVKGTNLFGLPTSWKEVATGIMQEELNLMFEDTASQYYGHILKTFLGEGIVREQVNLIVDPEPLRSKKYWLNFLP